MRLEFENVGGRLQTRAAQPLAAVRTLEAMARTVEAIEPKILLGPFQIAIGQIDAETAERVAGGGIYAGSRGVAEEVQKARALGTLTQPCARQSMIEKQTGVEITVEVDAKLKTPFLDRKRAAGCRTITLRHRLVLRRAALACAQSQMDALGGYRKQPWQGRERFAPPAPHVFDTDLLGRSVLLYVQMQRCGSRLDIAIDGEGILGHIRVVDAIAGDRRSLRLPAESLEILLQPIGEHLRSGTLQCRGLALAVRGFGVNAAGSAQIDAQQPTGDGAVPELMGAVAAQSQRARRLAIGRQDRCVPACEMLTQHMSQRGMQ